MDLEIVENLASHSRILAKTGKVRQAPGSFLCQDGLGVAKLSYSPE